MNYMIEFNGGLGDVFTQMYTKKRYAGLNNLRDGDTCIVNLITTNKFARELFEYHPKKEQLIVRQFDWTPHPTAEYRQSVGLPPSITDTLLPSSDHVMFYPWGTDVDAFSQLPPKYVVLAPSAGNHIRNIPRDIMLSIMDSLAAQDIKMILTGRTFIHYSPTSDSLDYYRNEDLYDHPTIINLQDKLSVPGTAVVVQKAAGIVTCHGALNLLAWHNRIPTLLLYPKEVLNRHRLSSSDQWMFGIEYPETVHSLFHDYTPELLSKFIRSIK